MMDVRLLSFRRPTASGWESGAEIVGAQYPCDLCVGFALTFDNNEEPIKHDESGKNSEDHEIIFQHWLDRVIERLWRTETGTSRVYSGMPDNPVGFVEGF